MDLSSRCVRPSHMHGNQVLLDQHGLPTHFSALGLLTKPPPHLDDACLPEAVASRELNRYYPQPPPPLPIDPMKYRYSGHSSSQSVLSRNGSEMPGLLPRHSDRAPFPPYRPGPVPSMHTHLTAFHAQLGSHPDPSPSLSGDIGMHLTLLSPLQRQDEIAGTVNHMPMPPITHSNLPPIPPPAFSLSRPVELYRLLNTPSPTLATHSSLASSAGTVVSEQNSCGVSSLGLTHVAPQTASTDTGVSQRSGILNGQSDMGQVIQTVQQNSSSPFQLSLPLSKEFHTMSKDYNSNKSSNKTLQCHEELPVGDGETDLLTVDEDETSSSASSEQSSIADISAINQPPNNVPIAVTSKEEESSTNNYANLTEDVNVDTAVRIIVDVSPEAATDSGKDNSDDNEPAKYLNRVVFCQVCRKGYGTSSALKKHMESHGPHRCTVCARSFPRQCNLRTHMAVHADRTFFCEECGKSYKSLSSLQIHKSTVHLNPDTGNVVCDACGVVLKNRKSLLQHEQMHTHGKRYSCDLCDERFNRKDALNRHVVRIHVEERFFNCQVCGIQCNTNEALQDHMWTHDAERPHECSCCKRRFPLRSALERHLRSHTGMRHVCNVCGTAFTRSYRLKFHMQRHHPTDKTASFENEEGTNENKESCGQT